MTTATALPLPLLITLGGALTAPLAARAHRRLPLVIGVVATAAAAAVLGFVDSDVLAGHGHTVVHYFGGEVPFGSKLLGIAFAADPFGALLATVSAGTGCLLLLSLLSQFGELGKREAGGLACLVQLLIAALIGAALTADTVNLFVWFEVAALSSYGLTGFFLERPIALEAAFKNLVLTNTASFAVFIGAALLYSSAGALNFGQLRSALGASGHRADLLALALLAGGFATKAGLMPFHAWLPDAHTPVPGGVSALFSGLMVNLGVIALGRITLQVFGPGNSGHLHGLLIGVGLTSAVLGAVLALAQDDLKRLLAWDTVSQMGIIVAAFATADPHGVTGGVYHLVNHALFKSLLFLCAGVVVHSTGLTNLSELGGLVRARPFLTAAFTAGSLAIAGIPPLNGYASLGLIHKGLEHHPALYAIAVVAQIITIAALARACYLGFYRRRAEPYEHLEKPHLGMRVSLIVLAGACLGLGVFAGQVVERLFGPAASGLLHAGDYQRAVLSGGGAVPASSTTFSYLEPADIITTAVEIVLAAGVLVLWLRRGEPRPVTWLRRLHTGSVNDYAAYLVTGFLLAFVALNG
jgi:multicomponent Na+:H+ antiporter subunit D